jgi:fumarate reductase subunit D
VVVEKMKRSNAPIFWLMFGGGGMLAALFGTMLVFITGLAAPLAWPFGPDLLSYPRALAFAQNWLGKAFLFAIVFLFSWHAAHRIKVTLHDVGIHPGPMMKLVCYGSALAITVVAAASLLSIGF